MLLTVQFEMVTLTLSENKKIYFSPLLILSRMYTSIVRYTLKTSSNSQHPNGIQVLSHYTRVPRSSSPSLSQRQPLSSRSPSGLSL